MKKHGELTNLLRVGRNRSRLSGSSSGLDVCRRDSTSVGILAIHLCQLNRARHQHLASGLLINHESRLGVGSGRWESKGRDCRSSHKGCRELKVHSECRSWVGNGCLVIEVIEVMLDVMILSCIDGSKAYIIYAVNGSRAVMALFPTISRHRIVSSTQHRVALVNCESTFQIRSCPRHATER
jgi:hypothetical protein